MKAFLLAAGKGTRLQPYTETIPKCLIPIHGKPLLAIWFDLLVQHGIDEVLVNTHHHAEKVMDFIEDMKSQIRLTIVTTYEPQLLGSAGTVWQNKPFVENEADFIIAYGDNLTKANLSEMAAFHRNRRSGGCILTVGLFRAPNPKACGIADLDEEGKIISFTEKPDKPTSNLANAGIFVASSELFNHFPGPMEDQNRRTFDFGFHVLPSLAGKMYGYEIQEYLRDIGTVESYEMALKEWPKK